MDGGAIHDKAEGAHDATALQLPVLIAAGDHVASPAAGRAIFHICQHLGFVDNSRPQDWVEVAGPHVKVVREGQQSLFLSAKVNDASLKHLDAAGFDFDR